MVRSLSPFKITGVESSDPRFRCEVPTGSAAIQRLPVNFLGGEAPGKISTKLRIYTTAAIAPVEADVSIDLTAPNGGAAAVQATPASESSGDNAVDPIFGGSSTAEKPVGKTF